MGTPIVDFQNLSNWLLVYNQSRQTQPATGDSYIPIEPFELPITLDKSFLAVTTNSPSAKDTWFLACWLTQIISVPGGFLSNLEQPRQPAKLNGTRLVVFPKYSTDYRLRVEIPFWIRELNIKIWEYVGPLEDSTEKLIEQLQIDIDRIEVKIDALS